MPLKEIENGNLKWVNISEINEESLKFLKTNYRFHHLDLEDLQSEWQTPKLDVYKNYAFVILQFPYFDEITKTIAPIEIDFFVGDGFFITIHHHKSETIKAFFHHNMHNKKIRKNWMSKTSGYLFCLLAESLYKQSRPTLNEIGKNIEAVEKDIFEEKQDLDVIRMLATYRRNILGFRRIIDPQRYLMANLSHIRTAFINEDTSLYFDNIHDYLTKLWALTDIYNDTINGLHVTVESLVNQRTSIVIRALTVISVSLLPLTLLSGIYGMNVDGMPFAKNSFLVFSLFIILSAIIILIILIMRKKRWI